MRFMEISCVSLKICNVAFTYGITTPAGLYLDWLWAFQWGYKGLRGYFKVLKMIGKADQIRTNDILIKRYHAFLTKLKQHKQKT